MGIAALLLAGQGHGSGVPAPAGTALVAAGDAAGLVIGVVEMMTVAPIMAGLMPILWSTGPGSEFMQRIAVSMISGMVLGGAAPGRHSRRPHSREGIGLSPLLLT
nr:hypothetical protein [Methylorubrum extorquens]